MSNFSGCMSIYLALDVDHLLDLGVLIEQGGSGLVDCYLHFLALNGFLGLQMILNALSGQELVHVPLGWLDLAVLTD